MKTNANLISQILFGAAIFCAGFSLCGWLIFVFNTPSKISTEIVMVKEPTKENMTKKPKEIYEIHDLEQLYETVEKMNLNKYHKERILKVIEFEKQVIEMSVYRDLGRERYLELIKEI